MPSSTSTQIQWNKYFDAIFCINYLPNKTRKQESDEEFKRVGIMDSGLLKYQYTFHTPFTYYINFAMPHHSPQLDRLEWRRSHTSIVLAYYAIFSQSICQGYRHVLIFEDDMNITQDLELLKNTLENVPEDWDYLKFDKIKAIGFEQYLNDCKEVNQYISTYSGGYWSTGMTGFSAKAMRLGMNMLEQKLYISDWLLENNSDPRLTSLKRYVVNHVLCMQRGREEDYKTGL